VDLISDDGRCRRERCRLSIGGRRHNGGSLRRRSRSTHNLFVRNLKASEGQRHECEQDDDWRENDQFDRETP